jgi:hypothetical protein
VVHHHDHATAAGDEIHRAAHAFDHLAGDGPVREVAVLRDLHRAEHADVDVTAADHRERRRRVEERRPFDRRDGLLAGVDEVRILVAFEREWPDAEQAVLALEHDVHAGRHVVRDERRHADAEVDVEAVAQLTGDALGHRFAIEFRHD